MASRQQLLGQLRCPRVPDGAAQITLDTEWAKTEQTPRLKAEISLKQRERTHHKYDMYGRNPAFVCVCACDKCCYTCVRTEITVWTVKIIVLIQCVYFSPIMLHKCSIWGIKCDSSCGGNCLNWLYYFLLASSLLSLLSECESLKTHIGDKKTNPKNI
ncbi:hypothetical protein fugu_004507 [Takifugu bimaculatus]|uniref:Uncharacterized protein n=1 Tax=Takifugu bimaculatus TaxID=433685 RepID=A0A4Z2BD60_9TELE|nr:hypothetical protein fugu_004507 [Takifugu bimaculatus]